MCDCTETTDSRIIVENDYYGETMIFDSREEFQTWFMSEFDVDDRELRLKEMKLFEVGNPIKAPAIKTTFSW